MFYENKVNILLYSLSDLDFSTIYIASGQNFPDGLSGSILAGKNASPMFLIGSDISSAKAYINSASVTNINVLGGIGVVPEASINNIIDTTTVSTPLDATNLEFVSTSLTKTGTNTATFQYKILDKTGVDITKTILASTLTTTAYVGSLRSAMNLNPATGTGTVTYNSSDSDKDIILQIMYSNGVVGMAEFSLSTGKVIDSTAVTTIEFTWNVLKKTGTNTATFNYKVENKFGVDITKSIPASQISVTGSLSGVIALNPLTATGTITYNSSSDVDKPITVSLTDKLTGITISSALATAEAAASESPKVSKITITSTKLSLSDTGIGYALYSINDQYGGDVTSSSLGSNVTFKSDVCTIAARFGLLIVTPNAGVNLSTLSQVVITGTDSITGFSSSYTLAPVTNGTVTQ